MSLRAHQDAQVILLGLQAAGLRFSGAPTWAFSDVFRSEKCIEM